MNSPLPPNVLDALADRATQGFDASELAAANALLAEAGVASDASLDHAAAALDLAISPVDAMPAGLRARLSASATEWERGAGIGGSPEPAVVGRISRAGVEQPGRGRGAFGALGWLAAAACLALAAVGWLRTGAPGAPGTSRPSIAAIQAEPGAVRWAWGAPADSRLAGLGGEVVFSPSSQQGVVRLTNLPKLDPEKQQYQLWIVDPDRKQPVDAGVFDAVAGASGEVLIPISAKLRVDKPAAFAITIERRGGVVVSDGPIAAVAAPSKS